MLRNRLALAAFLVAAAALVVLLAASAAPAENLESKLDAKEAKLAKARERSGVLSTTISQLGDRVDRLTTEVAGLRKQEAAVEVRLNSKQAELDRAEAQLNVAKTRLVKMRSHLKRALSALRDRLVAMYQTGTPDVLSVIVGANGYDDLIDRTDTSTASVAMTKRSSVVCANCATKSGARSIACAAPRTRSKRHATRSRPKSRPWPTPAARCSSGKRPSSPRAAIASPP